MQKFIALIFSFVSLFVFSQNTKKGLESINRNSAEAIIGFLASDAVKGREAGSNEGKIVAEYLASKLKEMGVKPLRESYFENFEAVQNVGKKSARWQSHPDSLVAAKEKGIVRTLNLRNILAAIPGKKEDEYIVIGAHYDHLGFDEKIKGDQIFNGADDNASGVSAVLQIAKAFVENKSQPERTVIFAFWDGEEKGLLGSRYFTNTFPQIKKVNSYLNFDMIGRNNNEEKPNHVVFFYTAANKNFENWLKTDIKKHYLNLEPDYRAWENPVGGSDNGSFAKKKIPILWYHTDGHKDYHQPSDTPEKLNWEKLIKITKAAYLNAEKMANELSY